MLPTRPSRCLHPSRWQQVHHEDPHTCQHPTGLSSPSPAGPRPSFCCGHCQGPSHGPVPTPSASLSLSSLAFKERVVCSVSAASLPRGPGCVPAPSPCAGWPGRGGAAHGVTECQMGSWAGSTPRLQGAGRAGTSTSSLWCQQPANPPSMQTAAGRGSLPAQAHLHGVQGLS